MKKVSIFWFRRDLRFTDNTGLFYALKEKENVLPIFIFDTNILSKLNDKDDARVSFLHRTVTEMDNHLKAIGSGLTVLHGQPHEQISRLIEQYKVTAVYTNRDYEPYAKERDTKIDQILTANGIGFYTFKDHVIFEKEEILSGSGSFYKVFTPYSNAWKDAYRENTPDIKDNALKSKNWVELKTTEIPTLESMGFAPTEIEIPSKKVEDEVMMHYAERRNYPAQKGTSRLGIHLRFGTISIRQLAKKALQTSEVFLNELIWRDFYTMILANNPQVVDTSFKPKYDHIPWRNSESDFKKWCIGETGYPIVDAGMRELNQTGFMHNRVRMIVASFLTKHLLIDWRWGEAYFAEKLLDFELASNNGGWQWAAGTGTDAQPYFRIFNPYSQTDKFDPDKKYIKKWVPEWDSSSYPQPMVEHKFARQRALDTYKSALDA